MKICLDIKDDMSKAEELAIMQKLHDAFKANPNNYLTSLFSNWLLAWVETQVKNDSHCDVMEYREAAEKEVIKVSDALRKAEAEVKSGKEILKKVEEKAVVDLQNKEEQLADLEMDLADMERLLQESVAKNGEITEMNEAVADKAEGLEMQIIGLKAKLYDAGVVR